MPWPPRIVLAAAIKAADPRRLTIDVVLYILVGLTAWILGTTTWLMLAGIGQQIVLDLRRDLFEHLTSLSLKYFSQQKAGWIIARLTLRAVKPDLLPVSATVCGRSPTTS